MEEEKKSSLATDLFGPKDSPASSSGFFGKIFPPPSKVLGRETEKKNIPAWGEEKNKDAKPNYYGEQKTVPFSYSSSIYYGGRDYYETSYKPETTLKKLQDGEEDESGSASRGNWWMGSLYY